MTDIAPSHLEDCDVTVTLTNIARLIAREAARGFVQSEFKQ